MKNISARNKGLITGTIMIALALFFFYGLKKPFESNFQYIIYGVYTAGIIWCLIDFKKTAAAGAGFKDYFSAGFKMFVVVTLMMVLFVFLFFYFNPELVEAKLAENSKLLLAEGNHTPAEIENNVKGMKRIFIPMMLGITTFAYLFLGALVTAIAGGFLSAKKNN
jgi:Protein of unknown function (DUF4199)